MCLTMTINGVSSDDVGIEIVDTQRPLVVVDKTEYITVPHRNGDIEVVDETVGDVDVTVTMMLVPFNDLSFHNHCRLVANWLRTKYKVSIIFSDDPDYRWHGRLSANVTYEQIHRYATFDVTFRCDGITYNSPIIVPPTP